VIADRGRLHRAELLEHLARGAIDPGELAERGHRRRDVALLHLLQELERIGRRRGEHPRLAHLAVRRRERAPPVHLLGRLAARLRVARQPEQQAGQVAALLELEAHRPLRGEPLLPLAVRAVERLCRGGLDRHLGLGDGHRLG
jgi:hypothetical protein